MSDLPTPSEPLTPRRLFGDPPLLPALPQRATFIPSTQSLVFLQNVREHRDELELWRSDGGEPYCWLTEAQLAAFADAQAADSSAASELTAAEKAERERRRLFVSGVTDFYFCKNGGRLLVPWNGRGFVFACSETLGTPEHITPADRRLTDLRLSPQGSYLSYLYQADLYYLSLADGTEVRVTQDGSATVTNGRADFIAQEEMHRFDGHWWSPDERRIAFQRTDDSVIDESHRHEIEAASIEVVIQRYPYAGANNAEVRLGVYSLENASTQWLDYGDDAQDYLARVDWYLDHLAVQVQSRNQQTLTLKYCDPGVPNYSWQTLRTETSDTWINLHDNFTPRPDGTFLWTCEDEGSSRLLLCDAQGGTLWSTPLDYYVSKVQRSTEQAVWFTGWQSDPTQQHLFVLPLTGRDASDQIPQQLTSSTGWHEVQINSDATMMVDQFSDLDSPPNLSVMQLGLAGSTAKSRRLAGMDRASLPYAEYEGVHCPSQIGSLRAADGQALYYRLTPPKNVTAPVPVVVYVYGGPGVSRVRNELPPLVLQLFAQRGIAVFELDNRGSSNRGRSFEAPIYKAMGTVEVADQVTGVQYLHSLEWVDAQRVGVFGHSYGGYMTLMCLAKAPELFTAGVSVAPVADWALYDTHYTERYMGTPQNNPSGYAASAVLPHLKNLQGQLLLIHGMADDNVLFSHSTALMHELQRLGKPFELMTYPGSKHGLQEPHVSVHRFNLILDFFARAFAVH